MKLSLKDIRRIIREALVGASPEYMRKEAVRQRVQELVVDMVADGQIQSDQELADFWKSVEMSLTALRMVPLAAIKKG